MESNRMDTLSDTRADTTSGPSHTEEAADHFLEMMLRIWGTVPEFEHEWDEWDEDSRLHYVIDWPVTEMELRRLRRWHDEGLFNEDQQRRYETLERYVEKYRPTLERLFEE